MELYSKKISIGEWKDYSISYNKDYAIFRYIGQLNKVLHSKLKNNKKNTYVLTYQIQR